MMNPINNYQSKQPDIGPDVYSAIIEALSENAIFSLTDEKGDIVFVNNKFIEISQYAVDELLGQNHRILKSGHQPQEIFVDLWATISRGKIWRGEIKNRAKDGKNRNTNDATVATVPTSKIPWANSSTVCFSDFNSLRFWASRTIAENST